MNDQIEQQLIKALMTSHPKPLARLALELRNYQRTAAGVEASSVRSWARFANVVLQCDFDTQKALRVGRASAGDTVTVKAGGTNG